MKTTDFSAHDLIILASDLEEGAATVRAHFILTSDEFASGAAPRRLNGTRDIKTDGRVVVALLPTCTYSEGFGDGECERAPEDRLLVRKLEKLFPGRVSSVVLDAPPAADLSAKPAGLIEFQPGLLKRVPALFRASYTTPNRQDYIYLLTKSFGLNLAIRFIFLAKTVRDGRAPLFRAAALGTWYQLQDAVFTIYGQTYMKFLGRMTGLLRVARAQIGDFAFVYVQFCGLEFLNRLVLGPLGENPLVYTWQGIGLIFFNILQGLISGGPLTPAINKLRKVGLISHSTMMHIYQLAGLTLHFGLFATFGYQKIYTLLTSSILAFSWGSYLIVTVFYKDMPAEVAEPDLAKRLKTAAAAAR